VLVLLVTYNDLLGKLGVEDLGGAAHHELERAVEGCPGRELDGSARHEAEGGEIAQLAVTLRQNPENLGLR
jgi:hypothetical protein